MERSASFTGQTPRLLLFRRYLSQLGPLCYLLRKCLQAGKHMLSFGSGGRRFVILKPRQLGDCDRMQIDVPAPDH